MNEFLTNAAIRTLLEVRYVLDEDSGVYLRADRDDFAYSDGDEVEARLAAIVSSAKDLSLFSPELQREQTDWPSIYHLSPTRANLLRPVQDLLKSADVLEVGAGCGAVTRFLGEAGARVIALEGSMRRASIAAARCRDLPNVAVVNDKFEEFEQIAKFDVISLIGVLEYSRIYGTGSDPVMTMLRHAYELLKEDGVLIVAIENQLGLKYFAGAREDHLGVAMAGVENRYPEQGVVTFGRVELQRRIASAGFSNSEIALPFPDYKLPTAIILPAGYSEEARFPASILASQSARSDPQLPERTLFSLGQTFAVAGENALLADLSNSFLLLAGKSASSPTFTKAAPDTLAAQFASNRQGGFTKQSLFVDSGDGINVVRSRLTNTPAPASALLKQKLETERFYSGRHWGQALEAIVSIPGWSVDQIAVWLDVWLKALQVHAEPQADNSGNTEVLLSGDFFDALPRNLIVGEDAAHFFDLEWTTSTPLSLGFMIFRAINSSFISASRIAPPAEHRLAHVPTLIRAVSRQLGFIITQTQIESHYDAEASYQDEVLGILRSAPSQSAMDAFYLPVSRTVDAMLSESDANELAKLDSELQATSTKLQEVEAALEAERAHVLELEQAHGATQALLTSAEAEVAAALSAGLAQSAAHCDLEAKNDFYVKENARLQSLLEVAQDRVSVRDGELSDLHEALQQSRTNIKEREDEITQLQISMDQSIQAREDKIAGLQAFMDQSTQATEDKIAGLQAFMDQSIQARDNEINRLWGLVGEAAGSEAEFTRLQHEANQALTALNMSSSDASSAEGLAAQLTARLVEIRESNSWRWMAPLRSLRYSLFSARRYLGRKVAAPIVGTLVTTSKAAYRALPVPQRTKMALKSAIFRSTGPLLSGTNAYRRWDAYRRTYAPYIENRGSESAAGPLLQNALWEIDGVREWSDYGIVERRIRAAAEAEAASAAPTAFKTLSFAHGSLVEIASKIKLPAPSESPEVTILIPTYNHIRMTLECIASICANAAGGPSFEILVADDASTDETAATLARIPNLRVLTQPQNLGFLRNCNESSRSAHGRVLVLLNNDVQVVSGWLSALKNCLDADPTIGAVGPRIVYPSGYLQEAGTSLRRDGTSNMIGLNADPDMDRFAFDRDVDYCSGACLMMRTSDFMELGGFDESYAPAYCEDSDLCMRFRQNGRRIVYCSGATVVHHLSKTSDSMPSDYKLSCIARNLTSFTNRWAADLDSMDDVRAIAFYLPQFHPIPENDAWWGPGFTEWTNVTKARPNFVGHYQPRVPADLGYYDLRVTEVMEKQAELARRYGLHGFCYYYYWFGGHRLLERPIEQMLASGRPDMPFCLCWANENWTRRWDGQEHDVLMAQKHSDSDDEAVIRDLIRYFRSPHYIRVGGRPLILVYRVTLFPDFARTAAIWRQVCKDEGIGDIYIAQVESFELASSGISPMKLGCDAAVEFPPQGMADPISLDSPILNPDFQGAVVDYRDIAVKYATRDMPAYKRFLGVMPGWDNTARRQNNSYAFVNSTPGAFQAWTEATIARTKEQFSGDERLIFINAWNEWAEGAYLEPDRRFGHSFLEAFANAKGADRLVRKHRYSLG